MYFLMALHFFRVGLKGDSLVKQKTLKTHKIAVGIIILIQFNFTIYLIPYAQWWAFAPFFIFFTVFFFDVTLTSWVTMGMLVSVFLSWMIIPDITNEPEGPDQIPFMLIRVSYLIISSFLLLTKRYVYKIHDGRCRC